MVMNPDRNEIINQPLIATITVGSDGRLYFHDLPLELLEVASAICPESAPLHARRMAVEKLLMTTVEVNRHE